MLVLWFITLLVSFLFLLLPGIGVFLFIIAAGISVIPIVSGFKYLSFLNKDFDLKDLKAIKKDNILESSDDGLSKLNKIRYLYESDQINKEEYEKMRDKVLKNYF